MYKKIASIKDIPDYHAWSRCAKKSSMMSTASATLVDIKTNTRLSAVGVLQKKYNLPDIDQIADAMDFEHWEITDCAVVERIAKELGLHKHSGRVQVLPPGGMSPMHMDDLRSGYFSNRETTYQNNQFSPEETDAFNADPSIAQRVFIFLEDARPGQIIMFDDQCLTDWKKGDVVHFDWQTVPHATINAGHWRRPLLRVTGLVTEKFQQLITNT